ncbi:MAG: hypothetical protein WCN92_08130, partial [Eubacteriales bacterium]
NMFDLIGPYYSSPTFCEMALSSDFFVRGGRIHATGIWAYELLDENRSVGRYCEFTPGEYPVYIRSFDFNKQVKWSISKRAVTGFKKVPDSLTAGTCFKQAFFAEIPAGTDFYSIGKLDGQTAGYPVADRLALIIAVKGDVEIDYSESALSLKITEGDLFFIIEKSGMDAWHTFDKLKDITTECLYNSSISFWNEFTGRRLKKSPLLDAKYKINTFINEAADDTATLIKSQQDSGGGVIAGYNYHLAYIRDNYGVHRGLLALGCYEEDKKLQFYYTDVFSKYGRVCNAQGMGTFGFHIHENDSTEITGYIVLMAMEYYAKTNDFETINKMLPLLIWCMNEQRLQMRTGCLPFNGDETYIAGGVLKRKHIIDGSMEATLLYYRAGELLLPFLIENNLAPESFISAQKSAMKEIEDTFANNFIKDGVLYCNKPNIYTYETAPANRNGVRECGHGFGTSYKTKYLRYVCFDCLDNCDLPTSDAKLCNIRSTALIPFWIGSKLIPEAILSSMLDEICESWLEDGLLPSSPENDKTVGYDYGLLLYALKDEDGNIKNEAAYEMLLNTVLSIRDKTGAWVEYYENNKPCATKCRPWESAVNIVGILK